MFSYIGAKWFAGLTLLGLFNALWVWWAGYTVDTFSLWYCVIQAACCFVFMVAFNAALDSARARVDWKWRHNAIETFTFLARFAEALTFFALGWIALRLFNHLSMATSIPYADHLLAKWDQSLFGLWETYFLWVSRSFARMELLDLSYDGLTLLSFLAFCFLFVGGKQQHARFFVLVFSSTAVICTTIGMFFPAKAAVATLLTQPEVLDGFRTRPGVYHLEILDALKTQSNIVFDLNKLPGLTTFPSFHTAAGIIMVYAFRRTWFFWPGVFYVAMMIAATPIYGGHYFVDIIAGTALALAVCRYFETRPEFEGVFAKKPHKIKSAAPAPSGIAISSEGV